MIIEHLAKLQLQFLFVNTLRAFGIFSDYSHLTCTSQTSAFQGKSFDTEIIEITNTQILLTIVIIILYRKTFVL